MYDLAIIGGGPAGIAAGVYAARKKIKTVLVTDTFGGQSLVSADIQNWIGEKSISGFELAQKMETHLRAQTELRIIDDDKVLKISQSGNNFELETESGEKLEVKTVLLTVGSRRRRLNIPGEEKYEGKGVVYCSTCDAPLFENKTVAVIGGGNAGLEAVIDLLPYASKIYLLEFNNILKGDPLTEEKIKTNSKVEIILNAETEGVIGEDFVNGLKYKDRISGEFKELKLEGVFVEIGIEPNSEIVKDLVNLNKRREVTVDHKTQKTSRAGIWAAGDITDVLYKQNNISAGDAVKAILNIYEYLQKNN